MIRKTLPAVFFLIGGSCAGNQPAQGGPLTEYLCRGRGEVAQITGRVEAANREEAEAKFKEQHKDVLNPTCTPNPR